MKRMKRMKSMKSMQRKTRNWIAPAAAVTVLLLLGGLALPAASGSKVVVITLDEAIHQVTTEYVLDGIAHAEEIKASAVLIKIYTPGGFLSDTRTMVNRITSSKVPVIIFVTPRGSRAASAGFFILMSADLAIMTPGTTTGAASPVSGGGEEIPETMKKKVFEDSAAFLRSYTSKRDRNPEVAELAVTEAKAFTDEEAMEEGLIDGIYETAEDIYREFDGKTIKRFDGAEEILDLNSPEVIVWEMTGRQSFLTRLADPNIAYLLFVLGLAGLYMEFNNPGLILPGVAGGISMVLALFATSVLPVNYAGVLLILLAVGFFIAEAFTPTYGVLTAGGVVSMVFGALMLVEAPPIPELRVGLDVALGVAVPFALVAVFMLRSVLNSRRWRVASGVEGMAGARGEVRQELVAGKKGMVMVAGELWRATSAQTLSVGTAVRVAGMEGLLLRVEPDAEAATGPAEASDTSESSAESAESPPAEPKPEPKKE